MAYWLAKVKVEEETSRGAVRWTTEQFLVNAENATDAEVKLTEEYSTYQMEWHVDQLKQIKLVKVIE
jgi:DNA-dependent RNA polymerase auxiliary subunit epsilon|tara:strand:+ start:297 stop:497 length:201 start_codon:yes stop_codon:yes gene_type:complete